MNRKAYHWALIFSAGVLAGIVSVSLQRQNWILPLVSAAFLAAVLLWLKGQVREVMDDERTRMLQAQAAERVLFSLVATAAPMAVVLVVVSRPTMLWLAIAGYTLAAVTLAVLLVYHAVLAKLQRMDGETDD